MKDFWSLVQRGAPGECWEWQGALTYQGYGVLRSGKRMVRAHRVAFALAKPSMYDPSLFVLHACDNPHCVRPGHLFQGTHTDNMQDMARKGRNAVMSGARCGAAKLTEKQVLAILADRRLIQEIASDYGIHEATVSKIRLRQRWKHLTTKKLPSRR